MIKTISGLIVLLVIAGLFWACDTAETIFKTIEKSKLAPPLGLRAEPQNGKVTLFWFTSNYESDFGGYYIFQAVGDFSYQSKDSSLSSVFVKVDSIALSPPQDREISRTISGLTNGVTYSFAVVAFKRDNRREISFPSNIVAATPQEKVVESKEKLSPPLGLRSVTGNQQVTLFWFTSNYENDFQGYYILRAIGDFTNQTRDSVLSADFTVVDSLPVSGYSDGLVSKVVGNLTNGVTYSFAVVSYAYFGEQISFPSNVIKDTPRPEIKSVRLKSASTGQVSGDDSQAGFDFNTFKVVPVPAVGYTSTNGADIINEAFDPSSAGNIRCWLAGMNGGGLQDLGYMDDLDDADVAPAAGYSEEGKSIAVLLGHVYAIKTGDNHFGKILITNIGGAPDYAITFNAAFQLQEGNRNYKPMPMSWKSLLGIHR
ncbi:MAG: hypothetical protein ONB31_10865 [candidate division KSB1 bacterium]|nr:hypothetical protein [candidate division KSB1 bacterium]MDZ7336204.1 hypothetical protein [candidate division KSB1 bacterium]MDZ7358992.1 hypothetical protein [candidate division KSB1 bacterium]MDZ7402338.1 hypothetical protein [candidate division KSB1 bacterium]